MRPRYFRQRMPSCLDALHVVSHLFELFGQTELILISLAPRIGHVAELTGCFFVRTILDGAVMNGILRPYCITERINGEAPIFCRKFMCRLRSLSLL